MDLDTEILMQQRDLARSGENTEKAINSILERRIKELRTALEWYSDPKNYERAHRIGGWGNEGGLSASPVMKDGGHLARETLHTS